MAKGSGSTRASLSGNPRGIAQSSGGTQSYAIREAIDRITNNLSLEDDLTEVGTKHYDLSEGDLDNSLNASVTITRNDAGNFEARVRTRIEGEIISEDNFVYNPVSSREVELASEDIKDSMRTAYYRELRKYR